ncbi:hypothetical protein HUU51_03200 [Candidatus Gracilibacteria bacterium]|nr:hypothetical protein [Candidatus Gracilibacteria bacterium]
MIEPSDNLRVKEYIDGLKLKIGENPNIFEVIDSTKKAIDFLSKSDEFRVLSSGLIVNISNKSCKGYCVSNIKIPIVCSRFENCNNFNRSVRISQEISFYEHQNDISDIY